MRRFVSLLWSGGIWNLLPIDVKRCKVAFKGLLVSQPCKRAIVHAYTLPEEESVLDCGCSAGAPRRTEPRCSPSAARQTPQRHAVKNNRRGFSHWNPVFPGKGLRGGSFPPRLRPRKSSSCSSSWTGPPLPPLSLCLSLCPAGETSKRSIEPLMYQLTKISNSE